MSGSSRGGVPEEVARFLRQRALLGGGTLFLDTVSRKEALSRVRAARSGALRSTAGRPAPAGPAPGGAGTHAGADEASGPAEEAQEGPGRPSGTEPSPEVRDAVQRGEAGEEELRGLDHGTLEEVALGCRRCRLADERKQVVFSDGAPDARLIVVGEAPGAREDATGLPFVGPAGKLLDLLLASVDLSREESVYICNVIKCRPPGNRDPRPDEIEACSPYLRRQIDQVGPGAILAVGTFAGRLLTGRSSTLGKLRGEVYSYEGVPLVVTYHPAALLRNRSWTRATWNDLQLLRRVLDGG